MADDTSYSTFLSKANEDPHSGTRPDQPTNSTSQGRSKFDPTVTNTDTDTNSSAIPQSLLSLPSTPYVSETDSDWEVVFFNYSDDTPPSLAQFKQVLKTAKGLGEHGSSDQEVEELSVEGFDPKGKYAEVVERVRKAGAEAGEGVRGNLEEGVKGVKVFRVQVTTTRVEYYVLTVGERKLVGVVAKAVES